MSDDHLLSDEERELEASLQEDDDREYDEGDQQQGNQHSQYQTGAEQYGGDQQQYDETGGGDGEFGAEQNDLSPAIMQLNLNGTNGPSQDEFGDPILQSEPTIFKVGEMVARTRGVVSSLKCDKTNGHVYIGAYTGELSLFDFNSQKELWRRRIDVEGRPIEITCLDIRQTKLAIGGSKGETVIFDLESFQVAQVWNDHKQRVSAIAWVGENGVNQVYTTSHDGYFLVRDADKKGKIIHSFITCTCPLSAMQVESPNIVYIGSWDGQVKKLDLEKKQVLLVMKANLNRESPIRCFTLAPSPAVKKKKKGAVEEVPVYILFIAHGIGEIKSWDMRTGKVHVEAYQGCNDVVNSMVTWNGKLYAAGDDRYVRMFDINSGVCIESLSGHENGVTGIEVAGVTPIVTPEMEEARLAAEAASHRSTSRKQRERAASAAGPAQQGVGNELLLTTGFDGQTRSYKLAAIEAAIQLKLLKQEEQKQLSFENYVASKTKTKGKKGSKKGSRKGSAKGKKKSGSSSGTPKTGSKKGSKKSSKAGSKASTAREGSAKGSAKKPKTPKSAASSGEGSAGPASASSSTAPKKKGSSKKKKPSAKKA